MRWMLIGLLLVALYGLAMANEGAQIEDSFVESAYDQVVVRFNATIKSYPSWAAFKTNVLERVPQDKAGTCYELTGGGVNPVAMTKVTFQNGQGDGWKKTSGNGWRQNKKDRTFIEYRVNEKARMLLRAEGVKPRFFFASTTKICEFPL